MSTGTPAHRAELGAAFQKNGRRLSNATILFHQAVADRLGMNLTVYKVLGVLIDSGPLAAGRLAEITGLATGAVTGIVDRLESMGYATRERDPGDRRKVIIRPVWTEESEEALGRIFAPLLREMVEVMAGYSDDEAALIVGFMDRHARALQRATREVRDAGVTGR